MSAELLKNYTYETVIDEAPSAISAIIPISNKSEKDILVFVFCRDGQVLVTSLDGKDKGSFQEHGQVKLLAPQSFSNRKIQVSHAVHDKFNNNVYVVNKGCYLNIAVHCIFRVSLKKLVANLNSNRKKEIETTVLIDASQLEGREIESLAISSKHRYLLACDRRGKRRDVSVWSINDNGDSAVLLTSISPNCSNPCSIAVGKVTVGTCKKRFLIAISDTDDGKIEIASLKWSQKSETQWEYRNIWRLRSARSGGRFVPYQLAFGSKGTLIVANTGVGQKQIQVYNLSTNNGRVGMSREICLTAEKDDCYVLAVASTSNDNGDIILTHGKNGEKSLAVVSSIEEERIYEQIDISGLKNYKS